MNQKMENILSEVQKVILGKQDVIEKIMMAMLADGHVLLDDVPGVGKTSLAVALNKTLGLDYQRIQFTPDVLPSDVAGYSIYDKASGTLSYMPGAVNRANLLLADEINRTSSKTQSALLEAMEERQVTVDGNVYPLKKPFLVIATENHVGTAGTQLLPHAQLDRFLVRLTIGYPDYAAQMDIIRDRKTSDPMATVCQAVTKEEFLQMQTETAQVTMNDQIVAYITDLAVASREHSYIELGISPRGAIAIGRMARACAYVRGRDYTTPADVQEVFCEVCAHRILLTQKAKAAGQTTRGVLQTILAETKEPYEK